MRIISYTHQLLVRLICYPHQLVGAVKHFLFFLETPILITRLHSQEQFVAFDSIPVFKADINNRIASSNIVADKHYVKQTGVVQVFVCSCE